MSVFKITDGLGVVGKHAEPFVQKMATVKNLAQSLLGCVWFVKDIPKAIRLLPTNVESAAVFFQSIGMSLKTVESCLMAAKQLGNVLEFPERLATFGRIKAEWNTDRCKAVYRLTSTFYIGLDAVVLIPLKVGLYNLLAIGGWAAKVGVTSFGLTVVKDAFTAGSSAINVVAEGISRDKSKKVILACQKRLDQDGSLAKLKTAFDSAVCDYAAINQLKVEHWSKQFGEKKKMDKVDFEKSAQGAIEKLTKQKVGLVAEKEKLSNFVDPKQPSKASMQKIANLDVKIQDLENQITDKHEKLERIKVWRETTTADNLEKLRKVVVYKVDKNQITIANKELAVRRSTDTRWYDIFKCAVVIFSNLIVLGVATVIAPALGASAVTIGTIFFLGRWVTGIGTGLSGLVKAWTLIHYPPNKDFALPRTDLLRA